MLAFAHDINMLRRVRPADYDAIQVRDKVFAGVFAVWIARLRRLPLFYWMSFPMSEGYIALARNRGSAMGVMRRLFLSLKGYVGRIVIYRYVLPRCTHVFVQSDRMLEDVVGLGIPRDRMTAVPMGVDLERHVPTREDALRDGRLQGRRVVAYLGSLAKSRGLDFLLKVMQEVISAFPDVVLLMVGDGDEPEDRQSLEQYAESLGIADRVVWTGWVAPSDAWRWLANADIAVSIVPRGPLYDCSSPTKVVEYLALGIPVVANDQPDQKKLLEESGAGICVEMSQTPFVRAIERILTDPQLAASMRVDGPCYVVGKRGYDRIAARVAEVYRQHIVR